jgi:site-specific DNA-cytosine methylase
MSPRRIRTVDLFCGCGGLSLGLALYRGSIYFETVLAVDNDPTALRAYNHNLSRSAGEVPAGRLVDLTWFAHRSEVLLYYLSHLSAWQPDAKLTQSLSDLGVPRFLQSLCDVDLAFAQLAHRIAAAASYRKDIDKIDQSAFGLALFKSCLKKLGLLSLRVPLPDALHLPWTDEYTRASLSGCLSATDPHPILSRGLEVIWDDQISRIKGAVTKRGKGQHVTVAKKMGQVWKFLSGRSGDDLKRAWLDWRTKRDSLRATFCLSVENEIDRLYEDGRHVELVLGGPPCKGWSRIGRAVIESLRDQGVHAWACHDYGDERNALLHKYVLVLDALRPTAFLFENVAHFQSTLRTPKGEVHAARELARAVNALSASDVQYDVASRIVRAREHAIPQDRERYIMVGARRGRYFGNLSEAFFGKLTRYQDEVPLEIALRGLGTPGVFSHGDPSRCSTDYRVTAHTLTDPGLTAAERAYIGWIRQPFGELGAPPNVDAHIVRTPRQDDENLFRFLAPGMRWMDYKVSNLPTVRELKEIMNAVIRLQRGSQAKNLPQLPALRHILSKLDDSLMLRLLLEACASPTPEDGEHHLLSNGYLTKGTDYHGDWLERLSPDRPCKTIVAHIGKDTYGYIHPTQPRALSMREAARVQTFPDFYEFSGIGVVDGYSMIGNAVPPFLALQFADRLATLYIESDLHSYHARHEGRQLAGAA